MKTFIIGLIVLIIIGFGGYYLFKRAPGTEVTPENNEPVPIIPPTSMENEKEVSIGKSVEGRDIVAYHYGTGSKELLFIGGIHGGYEWNTSLVAFELMDYLESNPSVLPSNLKVTVIPVLNPDGLNKVIGKSGRFVASDVPASVDTVPGRFNANQVDLNRNFDCDWKQSATWQNKTVSGGENAFSEPESLAIKNYVEAHKPAAAVVWYSAAGGVFASNCHNGVLPETNQITKVYADASGYKPYQEFNFYEITGDMVNWFAKQNIPAISVLLTNHTGTEWTKNKAGIDALFKQYSE